MAMAKDYLFVHLCGDLHGDRKWVRSWPLYPIGKWLVDSFVNAYISIVKLVESLIIHLQTIYDIPFITIYYV